MKRAALKGLAIGVATAMLFCASSAGDSGGRLVFSRGEDIWVANLDGSEARRVVAAPGPQDDPSWAPDGRRIVYRDSRLGYNVADDIYVTDIRGGRPRNLTHSFVNEWGPAWSPDGRWIAYNADVQLYVMHPDGSGKRRVARIHAEYPTWSPDSRRLAFMSARPGASGSNPDYDVYVVNLDGRELRRLTSWPGEEGWPAWSPDGRLIAFTTTRDDHGQFHGGGPYTDVYVMRTDGSHKRRVVRGIFGSFPVWSPNGSLLLFTGSRLANPAETLWTIRPDGSGRRSLAIPGTLADWSAS